MPRIITSALRALSRINSRNSISIRRAIRLQSTRTSVPQPVREPPIRLQPARNPPRDPLAIRLQSVRTFLCNRLAHPFATGLQSAGAIRLQSVRTFLCNRLLIPWNPLQMNLS
jgi:hypothetical protein